MTPRARGTIVQGVVAAFVATAFVTLVFATAAFATAGARAPATPSPKPAKPKPALSITITGPGIDAPIVIRSNRDPALYQKVDSQVEWMMGAPGNVMPSSPVQLGPHYTVTLRSGTTETAVYDLYPLVTGGPRAHRAAIGSQKAAWFFAPVSMASGLQAAGVRLPTAPAAGNVTPPTVATSAPSASLAQIMAQSKLALALAAAAASAVLVMLALAARRSRRLDRRRAVPAAIARLESVASRARGLTPSAATAAARPPAPRRPVPAAGDRAGSSRAIGTAGVTPSRAEPAANAAARPAATPEPATPEPAAPEPAAPAPATPEDSVPGQRQRTVDSDAIRNDTAQQNPAQDDTAATSVADEAADATDAGSDAVPGSSVASSGEPPLPTDADATGHVLDAAADPGAVPMEVDTDHSPAGAVTPPGQANVVSER